MSTERVDMPASDAKGSVPVKSLGSADRPSGDAKGATTYPLETGSSHGGHGSEGGPDKRK
jgi:hypothetical protein